MPSPTDETRKPRGVQHVSVCCHGAFSELLYTEDMVQKITKVGTSAAVIIPKDFLEPLGFHIGDPIQVIADIGTKTLIVRKINAGTWTEEQTGKHQELMERLAKR